MEDPQTPFDWICSDRSVIDAYVADPLCGFSETAGLDRDMLQGIQMNQKPENLARMDKKLPVLFVAGTQDPVGNYGKGVRKSGEAFRKAGMEDVTVKLYDNSRHEILNDVEKRQVYRDIFQWISSKIF
ncbi:MAG: serine aminopeptidase domain-containing protein [Oscillospiraceae bacterium]